MSDENDADQKLRLLHPPRKRTRWEPNHRLADFLLRLADQAASGEVGTAVLVYRREDGFGHFIAPAGGAEETLAMLGLLQYVQDILKERINSG